MRTTQFIGLTKKCREQVADLNAIPARGWSTSGMFNEDIPLNLYYHKDGSLVAIEYVIASPWSSGPMIFTGIMTPNGPSAYNWIEGTPEDKEYNYETGRFYV